MRSHWLLREALWDCRLLLYQFPPAQQPQRPTEVCPKGWSLGTLSWGAVKENRNKWGGCTDFLPVR